MMSTLPSFSLAFLIPWTLAFPLLLFNFHSTQDREKMSPFECGFDPPSKSRIPFSLRFFLLAVLFLIFDIEVMILLPIPIILTTTPLHSLVLPFLTFILLVIMGLLHEWSEGSLKWPS